ncbi:MAG: DUF2948 family protein [Phyllobacterium sp.]
MDRLKLVALDEEDLQIVSAHLQDAVLKVGDLDYRAREKRFVLSLNRFVWENSENGKRQRSYERRRAVLHFEQVSAVKATGIDRQKADEVLSLLAIRFSAGEEPAGVVELIFAGGAALRLDVGYIEAQLADLGAAWETGSKPEHGA